MLSSLQWRDTARSLKRAFVTTFVGQRGFTIDLCGQQFQVAYEARKHPADRDYPLLKQFAAGHSCILDVGLNIGLASLVMSTSMAGARRIYAFEASEEACRIAQDNFALNNLTDHIQVINALVGERSGDAIDFYWAHESGGASIFKGRLGHTYAVRKVALALDDFCERMAVQPGFIKIDVEGAEAAVLRGACHLLANCRPLVLTELHSWQDMTMATNAQTILEIIQPVNYKMIYLRTRQRIEDVSVLAKRGRCHVLLLPTDEPVPAWLETFDTSIL
jgi:FkbM family methyltransferase